MVPPLLNILRLVLGPAFVSGISIASPGPIDVSVNTSCYNNNNSLLVTWTVYSNGGRDISKYTLTWRKGCSNTPTTLLNSKTWMVSDNARFTQQGGSYIIPGLDGNTTYCIDVKATNSIGPILMSTTVKATTLSGVFMTS